MTPTLRILLYAIPMLAFYLSLRSRQLASRLSARLLSILFRVIRGQFYEALFLAAETIIAVLETMSQMGIMRGFERSAYLRAQAHLRDVLDTLERMANIVEYFAEEKYEMKDRL